MPCIKAVCLTLGWYKMPYKREVLIHVPISIREKLQAFKEHQGITWVDMFEGMLILAEKDAQNNPD